MSLGASHTAGAAMRSAALARPLSGAQWRDVRRAASTARAVGARSVAIHGVQLWMAFPNAQRPAAEMQQASSTSRPRRSTTAPRPEPEVFSGLGDGLNAKQRRYARRREQQLQKTVHDCLAGCKLRVVMLRVLKQVRWSRMQSVWTAGMRARQVAQDVRRREVLAYMRNMFWHAWTRPGATAGPGRLGATSERDNYIRACAVRAWLRFGPYGPPSMAVSAPTHALVTHALVEAGAADKRRRDTDGASSEASSGARGSAATTQLVVASPTALMPLAAQPPERGQRKQRRKGGPDDGSIMEGFVLPPGVSTYSGEAAELQRAWRVARRRQQEYDAVDEGVMAAAEQHFPV